MTTRRTDTQMLPLACRTTLRRIRRTRPVTAASAGEQSRRPLALLVEHRDEVFARLAYDMAEVGVAVLRARSAFEAQKLSGRYRPILVVSNASLLDQSGWLLAAKLHLVDPQVRIWLYKPRTSPYDKNMAKFLRIERLLSYGGDLLRLSETVIRLMTVTPSHSAHIA